MYYRFHYLLRNRCAWFDKLTMRDAEYCRDASFATRVITSANSLHPSW